MIDARYRRKDGGIKFGFTPTNEQELQECLSDPLWRICSGALYKIIIKAEDGEDGKVMPFLPNRAQRQLLKRLWHRNVILKARQLGFTTLVCIVWLDTALFDKNTRCGIIAQDREASEVIFRDKVKFAYENLPEQLKNTMPLARDSASELLFAHNNSSIRVATSMRSGTIHRLHISEFGKICAKYPDKAKEVVTGSIPAVPLTGILIIESTAEGREGEFYDITMRAKAMFDAGKELTVRDYRFHFFAWWDAPEYVMPPDSIKLTDKDVAYFERIESQIGKTITPEQRAWYIATRDADFSGSEERMWQEYPSTPEEAFQQSTEGCYYTEQLTKARKENRIANVPFVEGVPVNTFWDIGSSDGTAIWFHQRIGQENRFIGFYEAWGEPYAHFVKYMQSLGYVWGSHYLPHDATHKRQQGDSVKSPEDMLYELGLRNIEIVPRVDEIQHGIQATRDIFSQCWFDETKCKDGLAHLENYRKEWNDRQGCWKDKPRHDIHSEAADAFRQFAQGYRYKQQIKQNQSRPLSWKLV
jgi:hypothetical protein